METNKDQTILTGFGKTSNFQIDDTICVDEPQAASTAYNKRSREEVSRNSTEAAYERLLLKYRDKALSKQSEALKVPTNMAIVDQALSNVNAIVSPPKSYAQRRREYGLADKDAESDGEATSSEENLSILNLEGFSGKSSGSYLLSENSINKLKTTLPVDSNDKENVPTGLVRDLQNFNLESSSSKPEIPSNFLAAESLLATPGGKETTSVWDRQDPVEFKMSDISGRSTEFNAEQSSNLFNETRNNSLGSFGKGELEDSLEIGEEPSFLPSSFDEFQKDQTALQELFVNEEFGHIDIDKDQLESEKLFQFEIDESNIDSKNYSNFSGVHDVKEITIRPSWIESPEKALVMANNKINVDDLFRARSNRLGSLEHSAERPSFGLELQSSPPGEIKNDKQRSNASLDQSCDTDTSTSYSGSSSSSGDSSTSFDQPHFLSDSRRETSIMVDNYTIPDASQLNETDNNVSLEVMELRRRRQMMSQPLKNIIEPTNIPPSKEYSKDIQNVPISSYHNPDTMQLMKGHNIQNIQENIHNKPSEYDIDMENLCKISRQLPENTEISIVNYKCKPNEMPNTVIKHQFEPKQQLFHNSQQNNPHVILQNQKYTQSFSNQQPIHDIPNLVSNDMLNQHYAGLSNLNSIIPNYSSTLPNPIQESLKKLTLTKSNSLPDPEISIYRVNSNKIPDIPTQYNKEIKSNVAQPRNEHTSMPKMGVKLQSMQNQHMKNTKPVCNDYPMNEMNSSVIIPKQVNLPYKCLLGIGTEFNIPISNNSHQWVQINVTIREQSLNGHKVNHVHVSVQQTYHLEPSKSDYIKGIICGQNKGALDVIMTVVIVIFDSKHKHKIDNIVNQQISLHAEIEQPDIELMSDNSKVLNFGTLAEDCRLCKMVTIVNKTMQYVPIKLNIIQNKVTSPIFTWGSCDKLNKLSTQQAAIELEPALSSNSPTAVTLPIEYIAPNLINREHNIVYIEECCLQVELDTPDSMTILIDTLPIQAAVAAIKLRIPRQLLIEACSINKPAISQIAVTNNSVIPITLYFKSNENEVFKITKPECIIQPDSSSAVDVEFFPQEVGEVTNSILVSVEPNGIQKEISIFGKFIPIKPFEKNHQQIQRTSSLNQEDMSNFSLESTKTRVVFGSVDIGLSSVVKFRLKSSLKYSSIQLGVSVKGSKSFSVLSNPDGDVCKILTLNPNECQTLYAKFEPKDVSPCNAVVVFKPHGVENAIKCRIHLQGFGGRGQLEIPASFNESELVYKINPKDASMFQVPVYNTGKRSIFIKVSLSHDKRMKNNIVRDSIIVTPQNFVLAPGEKENIIFLSTGSPEMFTEYTKKKAFVNFIYGDQILRKRFCKLKSHKAQAKELKDPKLLVYDWGERFNGEDDLPLEDDGLNAAQEDWALFYNSCRRLQIPMIMELHEDMETSSMFLPLQNEDTMTSRFETTTDQSNISDRPNYKNDECKTCCHVFPKSLQFEGASPNHQQQFSLINNTDQRQAFEININDPWVKVTPVEGLVTSNSHTVIKVGLQLDKIKSGPKHETKLMIFCEDELHTVIVTATDISTKQPSIHPPPSNKKSHLISNEKRQPLIDASQQRQFAIPVYKAPYEVLFVSDLANTKFNLEIKEELVNFQTSKVGTKTTMQIAFRNRDNVKYKINAHVTGTSFKIKHTSFEILPSYFVNYPIYFQPEGKQKYLGNLYFNINEIKKTIVVPLSGEGD